MSLTPQSELEVEPILKSLLAGCFRQIAVLQNDGSYKTLATRQVSFFLYKLLNN
jgi:hypothetical protein